MREIFHLPLCIYMPQLSLNNAGEPTSHRTGKPVPCDPQMLRLVSDPNVFSFPGTWNKRLFWLFHQHKERETFAF